MRLQQLTGARNDMLRTGRSRFGSCPPARVAVRSWNTNAPDRNTFRGIFRESEAYTCSAVERGTSNRPGGGHALHRSQGRAQRGVRVVAQRQYRAVATQNPSRPRRRLRRTRRSCERLLPSAGRPLALAVTAFTGPESGKAIVRVNVDAGAFARDEGTRCRSRSAVMASDRTGRPVASAPAGVDDQRGWCRLGAEADGKMPAPEVNVSVASGAARLASTAVRVAGLWIRPRARAASVFSDVTVPKFESAALVARPGVTMDTASDSLHQPPAPTTRRVFRRETSRSGRSCKSARGPKHGGTSRRFRCACRLLTPRAARSAISRSPFTERAFTNHHADFVMAIPVANLPAGGAMLKLRGGDGRTAHWTRLAVHGRIADESVQPQRSHQDPAPSRAGRGNQIATQRDEHHHRWSGQERQRVARADAGRARCARNEKAGVYA